MLALFAYCGGAMEENAHVIDRAMPANLDAERFILGMIQTNKSVFVDVAATLKVEDFSLQKHRLIYQCMYEMSEANEPIDRVSLAEALLARNQIASIDGVGYLTALDEGIPLLPNIDAYIRIVKEKSTLRKLIFSSQATIDQAFLAEESSRDILSTAEHTLLIISGEQQEKSGLTTTEEILSNFDGGVQAFLDPSRRIANGLSTPISKLNEMTGGGLHPGELFILAARPSMGKTALALNIGHHAAVNLKKKVAVFSLEMSKESLLTRMMCASARVDQQKFRAGFLNQEERRKLQRALSELIETELLIDDTPGLTILDMHSKLRRLKEKQGVDLVILDYLQLMSTPGKAENRNQEVSGLSRALKIYAGELQVPFLVLSQLSRAPEQRPGDHKPQLSDLRESGSLEQDADVVAFIYREEVYKPEREDLKGLADLMLSKQRNGPTGVIKMVFLKECTKFENRISSFDDDPDE